MDSDSELASTCPLCCEELDATDRALSLCPCGFSMCLWCFHRIKEDAAKDALPARCPNCRNEYDTNNITMQTIDPNELEEMAKKQKKKAERKPGSSATRPRQDLGSVRVVQRNLVYVVGLAMEICYDDVLRSSEYFGQFGKPVKVSVNRAMPPGVNGVKNGPSGSAYVTFRRPQEAQLCIESIDGAFWHGRMVRACFGTTKYCNAFLKGVPCNNVDCLYLHAIAEEADSFTKEQMLSGDAATQFVSLTHPPALKQRAAAAGVHSATASSSVSHPVAPPAPGQHLQRSVTLPASHGGTPAFGASDPPLGNPAAVSTAATNGPSWAAVSAVHVPPPPPAAPPPPPPTKLPADQEWPSLGGPAASNEGGAGAAASRPDATPPAAPGAAGPPAGSETMAAQLARAKSAPSSAAANNLTRSASGKKLVALSAGQRSWATSKTLVPPPPPLAASTTTTAKASDAVPLTLPLPAKSARAAKQAAAPAPAASSATAAAKPDASAEGVALAVEGEAAASEAAKAEPQSQALSDAEPPEASVQQPAGPAAKQSARTAGTTASAKPEAKAAVPAPEAEADAAPKPEVQAAAACEVQPPAAAPVQPAAAVHTAGVQLSHSPDPNVPPQSEPAAAAARTPAASQPQPRRPLGPPPGFGPAAARKMPPPGFGGPLSGAPAASASQLPVSNAQTPLIGSMGSLGLGSTSAVPQQLAASGSALLQQLTANFVPPPPGSADVGNGTRRQSRFSFARAEAEDAAPAPASFAGAPFGAHRPPGADMPPGAASEQGQLTSALGAPPGFSHAANGPMLQQPLAAAGAHAASVSDAGSSGLHSGAALLRQLQASVGGSLQPLGAPAGSNMGLFDPAVMAAGVTCSLPGTPPGFSAPPSAARGPPPGFAFPLGGSVTGYGNSIGAATSGGNVCGAMQLPLPAQAAAPLGATTGMLAPDSLAPANDTISVPKGGVAASDGKGGVAAASEEKPAAAMVTASPRSSRGGKKKRGGKGRGSASAASNAS